MEGPGLNGEPSKSWSTFNFSAYFLRILLIILGIAAGANLIVDPFSIYGNGLVGKAEVNVYRVKLDLYSQLEQPPEALILGSSRAMAFDPSTVEDITGLS
ncbi:MAG TPA: hypothetical protein VGB30_01295 [bacterium]|jgi:hypothetical protein